MAAKPVPTKVAPPAPATPKKPFAKKDEVPSVDPLHRIIAREAALEPVDSSQSRTLSTISRVIDSFVHGGDLNGIKDEVVRLLMSPQEKATVMLGLLQNADMDRLKLFLFIRERTEKLLERAMKRGDLTCAEAIALRGVAAGEIASIRANLEAEQTAQDTTTLMEKVDYRTQQVERRVEHTIRGTSPQGREIIRRRIYALQKQMAAKNDA